MTTAGGLVRGITGGLDIGCSIVQIFTKSPQQWAARPLDATAIDSFIATSPHLAAPVIAHDSYLINLCAEDPVKLQRSRDAFLDELRRCEALGIAYLVTHMGSCGDQSEEVAIARFAESLNVILAEIDGLQVRIALETTAGQGKSLGYRFDHFPAIFDQVVHDDRLVVCFDTCHAFAAGYDLRGEDRYRNVIAQFDDMVGIDRLRIFHLNDSKKDLGSRVDRHHHLGDGYIGIDTFRALVNDPRFADRPKVLETPESETMHPVNLRRAIELAELPGGR